MAPVIDREPTGAAERSFWRQEARRAGPRTVLDLGCGSGRITGPLASVAPRVLGLDLSPHMLQLARHRLEGRDSVALVRGDVRRLPVAGGWDLVVAADGLFGHLLADSERQRALDGIADVLAPSGRLLVEGLWLPRPAFHAAAGEGWTRTRPLARPMPGVLEEVRERWRCDPDSRICRARFAYGPSGGPSRISADFRARVWDHDEIRLRLRAAGLEVRRRWGDFRRGDFCPDESSRLIVVGGAG